MLVAAASAAGRFGEPQRLAAESTSSLAANPAVPAGLEPPLVGSSLYAPNASTDFQLPPSSIPTYPASHPPQFPNTPSTTTDFQAANRPIEPSAMEGMSAATTTAAPEPLAESTGAGRTLPPLALDGHCPVTLLQQEVWEPGDSRYGALHMGSLYLFTSLEAQQTFLDDPYRYAPVLAGIDVVKLIDEQRVIPGQRQFGRFYPDPGERRVFLFADEASAARFGSDPDRYVRLADAIMKHALRTADAGGGSFAGQAVQ
jgi:YHS domain-containing protein